MRERDDQLLRLAFVRDRSLNMYGDCGSIFVNSQSFNFTACAPNATILFENLAPGDYYYPVLWDARRASGPYTLNVIASTPTTPCPANNTCATAIPMAAT
ncbi:MAG: hypothetical protein IPG69_03015 [Flavobacteriales bacterium]|nr:hypothetical protein [Flavobacteriales bacterium]